MEHTISFAYPSSDLAKKLGKPASGCFVLQVGGTETPHPSISAAMAAARLVGTSPSYWSLDNADRYQARTHSTPDIFRAVY
jgi:hypothetical protein